MSFAFKKYLPAITPSDQPYTNDGLVGSGGREAAFLVRAGVCGSPVPGVADSTSVRWRVFNNAWCICSYYAPHAGVPQETRVSFWRDFVAVCSACAECSQHSNGHRRRRQRVTSSTSLQSSDAPALQFCEGSSAWDYL